eukprot:8011772-Lingulodinium_polyedra.AAC.1
MLPRPCYLPAGAWRKKTRQITVDACKLRRWNCALSLVTSSRRYRIRNASKTARANNIGASEPTTPLPHIVAGITQYLLPPNASSLSGSS